ncbi:MAG: 3-oxoacyl-ACP synthase III [Candidatus Sericytochromatia bacterium]|nr:MAG: 3-oxoacyl-ACP synthase III [Candidatus Sericytochromatia bacterium]
MSFKFNNVSIISVASIDAPNIVKSSEIEEELAPTINKFGLRKNIIQELTGVIERRYWDIGTEPSEVATKAAILALEKANLDRKKVGVLINTSVCKDYIEPSVASLVHGNLELSENCLNFDIGNACLAFLNAIEIAGYMIEREQIEYALIVDGEGSRYIMEHTIKRLLSPNVTQDVFRANFATLTLGSGATAMILGRSDNNENSHKVIGGVSLAATKYNRLCLGQREEMITDASNLLVAGLELAYKTYQLAIKELEWDKKQIDEIIIHQVSATHTSKLIKTLNLDQEKVYKLYPNYGNVGPASIPISLSKSIENGRIKQGDRVALLGIGSGLNCSMMEVIW